MRVERLYENCWAILDGLRIVASGFESEDVALSYISLAEADGDMLTDFRACGEAPPETLISPASHSDR
jgi:hypothetical protein